MKSITYLLTGFLIAELISILAVSMLSVGGNIYPWTLISLAVYGFYTELALSFAAIAIISLLSYGVYKGGIHRIISGYALINLALVALALVIGISIMSYWCDVEIISLQNLINFIFKTYHEENEMQQIALSLLAGISIVGMAVIFVNKDKWSKSNKTLGNAHFASGMEVYKAGFFKKEEGAILVGKKYGVPLWSNGFEHVLVFAPTGSGKTRSIGMPNMYQYPYSVVCNDVKLTLYKATAAYREQKLRNKCFCWAPAKSDGLSHKYNPLDMISKDKRQRITDIQRIAHILIPDSKKSDPIWQQASRKLFKAILLYLLDTPDRPITLGEINRIIKQQNFDEWLAGILEEEQNLDPAFYQNGHSYLNNHEKTRSSILETLSGYFELFEDPTVDAATSSSDFDLRNLRKEKITIYIGFTDDDMERLSPLLTLFWQQLISAMIQNIPDPKEEPYPMLCLIDEFSSLGRIERLRRSLKLLREYRVRCVLMLQYIAQTYEQYSHDEAKAFTNIKTKIAFAAEDLQDAEYISKLLGTRTVKVAAGSTSSQAQGYSQSYSYNYQAVPLLRVDEVMRLPKEVNLILRTGVAAIKSSQFC
ncbi:TPA: type IV secretory system conjugative DNA transfer family protein [Legionella pneumophila]